MYSSSFMDLWELVVDIFSPSVCPSVRPSLPGPLAVDGEVTGDQRAPGSLLGYGVCHGWGHHPAVGL